FIQGINVVDRNGCDIFSALKLPLRVTKGVNTFVLLLLVMIDKEEATPLASKNPIIDYKIHFERNKPYFKIIGADGNHMLFLSFSTLLKNFDIEDLDSLWKLVKERNGVPKIKVLFSSSFMSKLAKSTGYTRLATSTNTSSAIPKG
nr:hypothetical protein [Tanacetum cinerariifolium]